ncbi:DTW domain-containing protein [Vibrio lamellibrachiae]|uniref:tRNA-uridine aminocarboxypropyltransferase n=1 Tax=Vibrio lamellibrachiae TaxID=2910253 RepID=UPI003D0E8A5E
MSSSINCPDCHLSLHCVCDLIPRIDSSIHIALLMHENELTRETNSGQWLQASLTHCSQHIWQRTAPTQSLVDLIKQPHLEPLILFPSEQSIAVSQAIETIASKNTEQKDTEKRYTAGKEIESIEKVPLFIILDGTWQEAKKMAKKIPWLEGCQHVHLSPSSNSSYQLRRNQAKGHLCTLEVGAELLNSVEENISSQKLMEFFQYYMKVFHADKCGHQYQAKL